MLLLKPISCCLSEGFTSENDSGLCRSGEILLSIDPTGFSERVPPLRMLSSDPKKTIWGNAPTQGADRVYSQVWMMLKGNA